ncbi:peptidoglycan-binding domain-containing protein [Kangiella shandongensis]|uniref:peptidoglycan-binding domain-containing protein n=1 Tax=Kangiella shandongensis TaxID=2763258 RepID=UPI001CBAE85F|nr:peptidoglycan-binding domain-containing protein [Kangiella shandongensis]
MERVTREGSRGNAVKRVQEWLCYHNLQVVIDGIFGFVTQDAVMNFQFFNGLEPNGVVDTQTYQALVKPMTAVLKNPINHSMPFNEAVAEFARLHLSVHPREFGGDNRGPWVRLYLDGHDGDKFYWCAGFVRFCMRQAAEALNISMPMKTSGSCDYMAAQGENEGFFVSEGDVTHRDIPTGSMFLVRKTDNDWTHVGLVIKAEESVFRTIEGNTNDDGSSNGYEVCERSRGYSDKDFIIFN